MAAFRGGISVWHLKKIWTNLRLARFFLVLSFASLQLQALPTVLLGTFLKKLFVAGKFSKKVHLILFEEKFLEQVHKFEIKNFDPKRITEAALEVAHVMEKQTDTFGTTLFNEWLFYIEKQLRVASDIYARHEELCGLASLRDIACLCFLVNLFLRLEIQEAFSDTEKIMLLYRDIATLCEKREQPKLVAKTCEEAVYYRLGGQWKIEEGTFFVARANTFVLSFEQLRERAEEVYTFYCLRCAALEQPHLDDKDFYRYIYAFYSGDAHLKGRVWSLLFPDEEEITA